MIWNQETLLPCLTQTIWKEVTLFLVRPRRFKKWKLCPFFEIICSKEIFSIVKLLFFSLPSTNIAINNQTIRFCIITTVMTEGYKPLQKNYYSPCYLLSEHWRKRKRPWTWTKWNDEKVEKKDKVRKIHEDSSRKTLKTKNKSQMWDMGVNFG